MKLYICTERFQGSNGRVYKEGETVSANVLDRLNPKDRKKFKAKEDIVQEDSRNEMSSRNNDVHPSINFGDYADRNNYDPAPNDNNGSDFAGFDGGDTGGGGASGDY